ncbi:MAG: hypothetical protein E7447_04835 [Ruminococcaceae bacterium]|nr:hypothetical protein [Oscillospiraceae bacterium]
MQDVSYQWSNKYIFPRELRKYYLFGGLLTSIGLFVFAMFMFYIGSAPGSAHFFCYVIAILFLIYDISYISIWTMNYYAISAMYYIDDFVVANKVGSQIISVLLSVSDQHQFEYTFSLGYARFTKEFVVLGDNIPSQIDEGSIFRIMKNIRQNNLVIIPKQNQ